MSKSTGSDNNTIRVSAQHHNGISYSPITASLQERETAFQQHQPTSVQHQFPPPATTAAIAKAPLSSSPGPDAIFLDFVKLDCSLPESDDGISVQSEEAALLEYPGSKPGSAELESKLVGIRSNGIGQEALTEAAKNNQWGIMPPADFAEEIHQLSILDHVAGLLDLKLNDLESPPNNPFSVLQDSVDSDEQEDLVDPVGRIVMNAQASSHAARISTPDFACSPHDPEIEGQQCCSMVEVSRLAKCSLTMSFAEKLKEGIDPVDSRVPSFCSAPVPTSDEDQLATLGSLICFAVGDASQASSIVPNFVTASAIPKATSLLIEPIPPVCSVANTDVASSGLPIVVESADDPAVVSAHSHHDAWSGHHDMDPALVDDPDLTPNSITLLSSKYSLDASSNLRHDTISPEGSSADDLRAGLWTFLGLSSIPPLMPMKTIGLLQACDAKPTDTRRCFSAEAMLEGYGLASFETPTEPQGEQHNGIPGTDDVSESPDHSGFRDLSLGFNGDENLPERLSFLLYCALLPITISRNDYERGQTNPGTSKVIRFGAADRIETKTKPEADPDVYLGGTASPQVAKPSPSTIRDLDSYLSDQ
ncbi:hypothetical protein Nepgr_008091 [Nepenthes gracilis]|uniref:Uncharacterized protein n=1 Tax=Nepenthes gracilis TaxID=150966 RepID=A0AAD3S8G1_NEPGR|nr:hypothetical protein Nepgr_008091 [Nepenthes gracilis]